MVAEVVAVRLLLLIHTNCHIPESYPMVCIYVKQHQTLSMSNLVFDPKDTEMLFLLFKNALDSSYISVILFGTDIGHAYKESSIKSFEVKR